MAFGGAFCSGVTFSITSAPSMSTKIDALALKVANTDCEFCGSPSGGYDASLSSTYEADGSPFSIQGTYDYTVLTGGRGAWCGMERPAHTRTILRLESWPCSAGTMHT
ncbi:hypothetical protein Esi_0667_0006 [Ectocarpus siliculosus]|uniref:Uncharacterized protein n=1 Tax=Ectocarpus siliculosus TaxID=2880 RepID=D7G9J9_ECTSI|nr:hypothetical protein Esi_0667_0006 [Ectocarpus siliculosus]|eukprot:CBJ33883.1 hypothetical protein Esi_0667_0006 [Ectocarpus siliculosus]